jgi:hypothetical protein
MSQMSAGDPRSFSKGLDLFFDIVRPYSKAQGEASFPGSLSEEGSRRRTGESHHACFVRVVDESGGDPALVSIEENIAVLARIKWSANRILNYANIQAIVTPGSLVDFYLDPEIEGAYLRLDCDELTLGDPFSHPHPHIHLEGSMSPRFAFDGGTSENVLVDFMEFLYRHYRPRQWLVWARRVWDDDFAATRTGDEPNPFPRIEEAFRTNQFQILRDDALTIGRLKDVLKRRKADLLDLRLDRADREILEYPLAR